MNGTTVTSHGSSGSVGDLHWKPAAIADFTGDGKSDILFRHQTSGEVFLWMMNGKTVSAYGSVFTVSDLDWQIAGTGDHNGDGKRTSCGATARAARSSNG